MAELLEAVASWPSLLMVIVVFGFAPGFCLRLIVLAYPRSDPRRRELIAELYAVPRIQRPLWVAEQLEVALFEGLSHRASAATHWLSERRTRVQTGERGVRRIAVVAGLLAVLGGGALYVNNQVTTTRAAAERTSAMLRVLESTAHAVRSNNRIHGPLEILRVCVPKVAASRVYCAAGGQTVTIADVGRTDEPSNRMSVLSICLSVVGLLVTLVAMRRQLGRLVLLPGRRARTTT
jgi:hypothetical protein